MIEITRYYYLIFGLLTIAGGVMGYVSKRSIASIVSGSICGILLIFASYLTFSKVNEPLILGLVVSVALAGKFLPNYIEKKTPVPGGLMALLSLVGIVVTILAWYKK